MEDFALTETPGLSADGEDGHALEVDGVVEGVPWLGAVGHDQGCFGGGDIFGSEGDRARGLCELRVTVCSQGSGDVGAMLML